MIKSHRILSILIVSALLIGTGAFIKARADYNSVGANELVHEDADLNRFVKAAEHGNPNAQYALGIYYYRKGDLQESAKWHSKAAESGNAVSQGILKNMKAGGFKFTSDSAKGCDRMPEDWVKCIKRDAPAPFKRYVSEKFATLFDGQAEFTKKKSQSALPKTGMASIGETYQDFAPSVLNAGYVCDSFKYISRAWGDLSDNERSNFLSKFYHVTGNGGQGFTSLKEDTCRRKADDGYIKIFLTMMGTIYYIEQSHTEETYGSFLPQFGYSQNETSKS